MARGARSSSGRQKALAEGQLSGRAGRRVSRRHGSGRPTSSRTRGQAQEPVAATSRLSREVHRAGIGFQDENVFGRDPPRHRAGRHVYGLGGGFAASVCPERIRAAQVQVFPVSQFNVPATSTVKSTPNSGSAKTPRNSYVPSELGTGSRSGLCQNRCSQPGSRAVRPGTSGPHDRLRLLRGSYPKGGVVGVGVA